MTKANREKSFLLTGFIQMYSRKYFTIFTTLVLHAHAKEISTEHS